MLILAFATALWLGILTSISPCPLATNVAAISYIGRHVGSPSRVLWYGVSYTLGRAVTYIGLSIALVAGLSSIPEVSYFLQRSMNKLMGPLLILVGMVLLDMIRFEIPSFFKTSRIEALSKKNGTWNACLLGMLFALSLCPVAAALFFGALIPLAVKHGSSIAMPSIYGFGTGLPVIAFALVVAFWAGHIGKIFDRISRIEQWAQTLTGIIFIAVGIYYSLNFIFEIL
jgi:cytochrome c-type biogenesis protein